MAIMSPSTFDPLRRYVAVRLQQGVPLVDADWNEAEDARKFELRSYLRWFAGTGVPDGNDGFRIGTVAAAPDDLMIVRGTPNAPAGATSPETALGFTGRMLVDGLEATIAASVQFRGQPLHVSQPGAATLAAAWGVPTVPELPRLDKTYNVYLDVWERLVTQSEDPSLILPGLGTESCARFKREWVVRWRDSAVATEVPQRGDSDWLPGHGYALLATVARHATGTGIVAAADIVDQRPARLLALPASLVEDTLGTTASAYRRGQGRPKLSLRDAINAGIAGEIPMSKEQTVQPPTVRDVTRRSVKIDGMGGIMVYSQAVNGGSFDIQANRIDAATGTVTLNTVATGTTSSSFPDGVVLPSGESVVSYLSTVTPSGTLVYKRGLPAALATAAAQPVATNVGVDSNSPLVVRSDKLIVFLWRDATTSHLLGRRLRHTDNTWLDATSFDISGAAVTINLMHAISDAAGMVWCTYTVLTNNVTNTVVTHFDPTASPPTMSTQTIVPGNLPMLVQRASGDILVFFQDGASPSTGIRQATWVPATSSWNLATMPNTGTSATQPWAFEDGSGAVWALYQSGALGPQIFAIRWSPMTNSWGQPRCVVGLGFLNFWPHTVTLPNDDTWLFWLPTSGNQANVGYKRILTRI